MNKVDAISIVQFTLLLMTAVGLKNHVLVIPFLLQNSGRDAWITTILAAGGILIWSLLVLYIHNKTKAQNIFDWIEHNIGKIPRFILSSVLCFYLSFPCSCYAERNTCLDRDYLFAGNPKSIYHVCCANFMFLFSQH